MINKTTYSVFWFRRDLRIEDNHGLYQALVNSENVIPVFIFDTNILSQFDVENDKRIAYILQKIIFLKNTINLQVYFDTPNNVFQNLVANYKITSVYTNQDYEPQAIMRDTAIKQMLHEKNITFNTYKDQVIFHENDVVKNDGSPYTVFTPFSKKWKEIFNSQTPNYYPSESLLNHISSQKFSNLDLNTLPFYSKNIFITENIASDIVKDYDKTRDFPYLKGTSELATALRFGTISVRKCVEIASQLNQTWLNELIWREFFMQILYHFPQVTKQCFKPKYENIVWRNNEQEFELWCEGKTGYAIVDAGMRELNQTGKMHNRVRMIVASFLCKHLLIDWRWGEAYFAQKLLDYDLSANNGNWQWAAGCGCDAAPYFRVFNPYEQTKKFDPNLVYIKKWIPEYNEFYESMPIVEHRFARERALATYKKGLE
jgi:deoxyribodipyrimidine photo-lyase